MIWADMSDNERKRAIERLNANNLSRKNIASRLKAREHTVTAFIAEKGLKLKSLKSTNQNKVTQGVAQGWWYEADSPQYRKFIVDQDLKFQRWFRQVYRTEELGDDEVEMDDIPDERPKLFTKPIVEEYVQSKQDALDVIREARRLLDFNAVDMNDIARGTKVIKEVAVKHRVTIVAMRGENRSKQLVNARREAVFRLREECGYSFPRIGNMLGGRDHSTAMHNYKKFILSAEELA